MSIVKSTVRSSRIYSDDRYPNRWLEGFGPDVIKFTGELQQGMDGTTGYPNAFTTTVTEVGAGGSSDTAKAVIEGQLFLLTTDNADYDGHNLQLAGESFKLEAGKPAYFGIKFEIDDADQTDMFFGLAETDTTLMATGAAHAINLAGDGAFFSSLDGSLVVAFKAYDGGAETNSAQCGTALVDATAMTLEFYFDGENLMGYQNGKLVGTFTAGLPNTEITLSLNFRTGETTAQNLQIYWLRAIQAR